MSAVHHSPCPAVTLDASNLRPSACGAAMTRAGFDAADEGPTHHERTGLPFAAGSSNPAHVTCPACLAMNPKRSPLKNRTAPTPWAMGGRGNV